VAKRQQQPLNRPTKRQGWCSALGKASAGAGSPVADLSLLPELFVFRGLGEIAGEMAEFSVVVKKHGQSFLGAFATAGLEAVDIIPAILIEGVAYQWRTQNEVHLSLGKSRPKLVNHGLGDDVALGNINAINAGKAPRIAAAKRQRGNENAKKNQIFHAGKRQTGSLACFNKRDFAGIIPELFAGCQPGSRPRSDSTGIEDASMSGENQELRKAGLKVTLPRVKIMQILENAKDRHLSAEDVYKALRDADEDVGLATVYRVLTQFESAGLVMRHHFEGGHSVFEMMSDEHHDHIVCTKCGRVEEFIDELIEERQLLAAKAHGFTVSDHSLYIYGLCENCQTKT
jgi:Fur family transcriptional regulator, ferric uptake regulator